MVCAHNAHTAAKYRYINYVGINTQVHLMHILYTTKHLQIGNSLGLPPVCGPEILKGITE